MTERLEFYKCEICGNLVQVFNGGAGELVCCEMPMKKLEAQTKDTELNEKHVPIFVDKNLIQVGSVPHPMIKEHYIQFIQCISEDNKYVHTKFLNFTDTPQMNTENTENVSKIYEYCNIHNLWEGIK